jgi:ParB family transcriptional regulator, chromosome partitioning protein
MNKTDTSRKALGRGIGSLLPTRAHAVPAAAVAPPAGALANAPVHEVPAKPAKEDAAQTVPIANIDANPLQPRRTFDSAKLAELAQSIRTNGIIQPLVVRKVANRLQLVAGERRLRAAKLAGLESVPVLIQEISDEHLLEITLIENIQREDLNPIETAIAFERLSTTLNLSPEEIGRRTGKDRSTISNSVRLLQLPQDIQSIVAEGKLTAGHARCLLKLPDSDMQREVAAKAVEQDWSVRQLERTTAKMVDSGAKKTADEVPVDPNVKAAILEMERVLGTKVRIVEKAGHKGRIEIDYYSTEDLDRIYEVIVPQG